MLRQKGNKSGFSLLEVIVALAILSIAIVSIMELMGTSLRTVAKAEDYSRALLYGRALMEHAYATNDPEDLEDIYVYDDGFSAQLAIEPLEGNNYGNNTDNNESKMEVDELPAYELTVIVSWGTSGKLTLRGTKTVYEADDEGL